jgi:hypothetical protein
LGWVRIATNALRAQAIVDVITPEMCAGHFDDYPAMPVAMLMLRPVG